MKPVPPACNDASPHRYASKSLAKRCWRVALRAGCKFNGFRKKQRFSHKMIVIKSNYFINVKISNGMLFDKKTKKVIKWVWYVVAVLIIISMILLAMPSLW